MCGRNCEGVTDVIMIAIPEGTGISTQPVFIRTEKKSEQPYSKQGYLEESSS
jgi:hypothetical protein